MEADQPGRAGGPTHKFALSAREKIGGVRVSSVMHGTVVPFCENCRRTASGDCGAHGSSTMRNGYVEPIRERKPHKCPACDGRGKRRDPNKWVNRFDVCNACGGTGLVWEPKR